jgi:hypothetical protein
MTPSSTRAKTFALAAVATIALGVAPGAKAQVKGCSNATLKGTFSQRGTGYITSPASMAGPIANVGTLTFDGNGRVTGSIVNSINGVTVPPTGTLSEAGTYQVNADCTGTYTVQITGVGPGHAYFVIDDNRNGIQILTTDPGVVILCIARRQFPSDDWWQ